MLKQTNSPIRLQIGLRGWIAIVAGIAALVATFVAVAFLAFWLFVLTLPVLVIATIAYYFRPRSKLYSVNSPANASKDAAIIDGNFRVINAAERNPDPTSNLHIEL